MCSGIENYSDSKNFKYVLSEFIKANKIKIKQATLILNSRNTVLKCTSLNVPPDEVGQVLCYDLKSYILIDPDEYIFDYRITKVVKNKTHILIAAAPKDEIFQYITIFKDVRIKLTNIDIYQNLIARAFAVEDNALVVAKTDARLQLIFSDKGTVTGVKEILFIDEASVVSEISKLFDSFLTNTVFETVFVLSKSLTFIIEYFNSYGINCKIREDADFLALREADMMNGIKPAKG